MKKKFSASDFWGFPLIFLGVLGQKRQHLAVAHEKGKITVLQLSALLKQADSTQKKLTLTRLSSAPVPFTVLSLISNPINENFLAVCGLKDCHVLTFNSQVIIISKPCIKNPTSPPRQQISFYQ